MANRAEEEPARSRRAGRRPKLAYAWQDPELAADGVRGSIAVLLIFAFRRPGNAPNLQPTASGTHSSCVGKLRDLHGGSSIEYNKKMFMNGGYV